MGNQRTPFAAHVGAAGIGLQTMGAYRHTRIRALLMGSTATALLRACRIGVPLTKPDRNASAITRAQNWK